MIISIIVYFLLGVCVFFGFALLLQMAVVIEMIIRFSKGAVRFEPLNGPVHGEEFSRAEQWANEHDFRFAGVFQIAQQGLQVACWYSPERTTLFLLYLKPGLYYVISTQFEGSLGLLTSGNSGDQICPLPPGMYAQAFHGEELHSLLERHEVATRYLTYLGGAVQKPYGGGMAWPSEDAQEREPFAGSAHAIGETNPYVYLAHKIQPGYTPAQRFIINEVERSLRIQGLYVRSLPLWWLRLFYWLHFRKRRMNAKPLEELVNEGYFLMPQELPPDYRRWDAITNEN